MNTRIVTRMTFKYTWNHCLSYHVVLQSLSTPGSSIQFHALYNTACFPMTFWKGDYYADCDSKDISRMKVQSKSPMSLPQNKKADLGAKLSVLMQMLCTELNRNCLVSSCQCYSDSFCIIHLRPTYFTATPEAKLQVKCISAPNI